MKKIIAIAFIVFTIFCISSQSFAEDIGFQWDPNTESYLVGYRLYQSQTSGSYTFGSGNEVAEIPAGTETCTLTDVPEGTYFWVLTAYSIDGEK